MQFLYRIEPTRLSMLTDGPTEHEQTVISSHAAYVSGLADNGTVLVAGRTLSADEDTFGIVILDVPSEEAAQEVMEGDPAVMHGVMSAKLFPFRIAFASLKPPEES